MQGASRRGRKILLMEEEGIECFQKERSQERVCQLYLDADTVEGDRESDDGHPWVDGDWSSLEGTRLDSKRRSEERREVASRNALVTSGVPKSRKFTLLGPASVWRKRHGKGMGSSGLTAIAAGVVLKWMVRAEPPVKAPDRR